MQTTVNQGFRLSPGQKYVWLAQQGRPCGAGCTVLIEGKLDLSALEEALRVVTRRHDILRTTFRHLPGMKIPVQLVDEGEVEFQLEQRLPETGDGPLRASLEALEDTKHLLHISLPALCADAWSLKNLVREIAEAYAARNGQTDEEVTQYVQFSEWQNELLEAEAEQEGREFWRARDFSTETESTLPFEIPTSDTSFTPLSIRLSIDSGSRQRVESFARQRNTTVEVFLLACWQALLWKLLRRSQLVIGQTFHGRSFEELHGALGLFARDLPVQCQFEENTTFRELLEQCDGAVREAYQWQDYFTADRRAFTFGFEYASALPKLSAAGVRFSTIAEQVYSEPFKLKLTCREDEAEYGLEVQYDAGKIERADAERLGRWYVQLVRNAVAGAEVEIRRLEVIEESEREQVLVEWNRTAAAYELGSCVHEVIEQQAARRPEAVAVVCEEESITYSELNRRANQLAHYLRACGIGPEARVGLLLERSVESVVALLAVLKAGAAYVPLDGALPTARLSWLLADAGVQALITRGEWAVELPAGVKLIRLDEEAREIERESTANPGVQVAAENLAYVIYTSGSTGQAKGIGIEQRQLLNYIGAIRERLGEAPRSYATVSTFAADLGHTMIFPALCSGATLHVITMERAGSSEELGRYMRRHEVECLKIVPSHLQALLIGGDAAAVLPQRWLVLGGEAAGAELVRRVQELRPGCRVLNHYGPTETTVGVLAGEVSKEAVAASGARVALGRPLGNVRAYILDETTGAGVLPAWLRGELYIGGASVGRGYLRNAAETAARFVPDPYGAEAGGRLYRTGDRARWRGDGQVEFLGRVDHQVKVRGYRVELGEVEAVLRQHEAVAESVVVLREEQLVGYYVRRGTTGGETPSRELRRWLSERLPEYMVPWVLVEVARLPLTANGKIDVRALPAPEALTGNEQSYVGPRTEIEEVLAGIWSEVLRVERVGVRDNFFELGGHSLLAMQIISRVRQTFQAELPLHVLFEATTVEELAHSMLAYESKPGQMENVANLLQKIKNMSSADIREALEAKKNRKSVTV